MTANLLDCRSQPAVRWIAVAFFGPECSDSELTHRLGRWEHLQRQRLKKIQRFAFRNCHDQICACSNKRGEQAVRKSYGRRRGSLLPWPKGVVNQSRKWAVFDDA